MENMAPAIAQSWFSANSEYMDSEPTLVKPTANDATKLPKRKQEDRAVLGDITLSNGQRQSLMARTRLCSKVGQQQPSRLGMGFEESLPPILPSHFLDPEFIDGPQVEKKRKDYVDVDILNHDDPQACSGYAWVIFKHMRESELTRRANPSYFQEIQHDINPKMRAILVDWLVEVAEEYRLCADTLYQCVNYLDRLLSVHVVPRNGLQLVGTACMWVASKYEEMYPPTASDFCYITDNTYTKEQIISMEEVLLKKLGYELTVPTSKLFLRRLLQVCSPDEHLHYLSNYLTEITLIEHTMLKYLPSEIASAAVYLANLVLKREPWDGTLSHYSMYSPADIQPCVKALSELHISVHARNNLVAIRKKYAHVKFKAVSTLQPLSTIPDI